MIMFSCLIASSNFILFFYPRYIFFTWYVFISYRVYSHCLLLFGYSLICIEQFYRANDNVYVLYISCIIFCYAVMQVCLSFVQ